MIPFSSFFQRSKRSPSKEKDYYAANYWQLVWKHFLRHKTGRLGIFVLGFMAFCGIFASFLSPVNPNGLDSMAILAPSQMPRFWDSNGFSVRPFVYAITTRRDPVTLRPIAQLDPSKRIYIHFFVSGFKYKILGIKSNIHLFGTKDGRKIHILGTDELGRDFFSRMLYATGVSLSIGAIGVLIAFVLALVIGGISGYFGGIVDNIIQRLTEIVRVIPVIPLYMGLAAAFPKDWSSAQIYFAMTLILGLVGWPTLSRRIRSQFLMIKNEDYVLAARVAGASHKRIILRHLLPSFISYIIIDLVISFPYMILSETALSFIGLGLRPPTISWGVLLQSAQSIKIIEETPRLLFIPTFFIFAAILSFVVIGDALRDASNPYENRL